MKQYGEIGRIYHSALRHAYTVYIMKEPTWNLSPYNRHGGIVLFLENNT